MDTKESSVKNKNFSATIAVSEAYLAVIQDISQGFTAKQIIAVNCDNENAKKLCTKCVKKWAEYRKENNAQIPLDELQKLCEPLCACKMSDIKLGQQVAINLKSFMENTTSESFSKMVMNSLAQNAQQEQQGLFEVDNRTSNTIKTINELYTAMKSKSFQRSMEDLRTIQTISLSGPGDIFAVDMTETLDYISTILQTNSSTSEIIQKLEVNVLQLATQVANAGLAQLIAWIVRIVILIIILIVLFYASNLVLQIFSLYIR